VPDLQYEGAEKRRGLYRKLPHSTEIRLLHFGKAQLQPHDVINSLDGQCWLTLYNYINRNNILTEDF